MASSVPTGHFVGLGSHLGNMWTFVSCGRTGTGSQETIAHGQGRVPLVIQVCPDDSEAADYVLGVATKDNILLQVANGQFYSIVAHFGPGPV